MSDGYAEDSWLGGQSAAWEARGLYKLLSTGHSVEDLRALIAAPPRIERVLRDYARAYPKEASLTVTRAIKFRASVLQELTGSCAMVLRSQIRNPRKWS